MLKFRIFENPRWRRPPSWKITKIAISPQRFDRSLRNLESWCKMGPLTVKKLEFHKSKMADSCHSENRKIAIFLQSYDRFWWKLAQWHILAPYRGSFVKITHFFENPTWRRPPCWKSQKSRYLHNGLTNLYEIWYADAKWVSSLKRRYKIEFQKSNMADSCHSENSVAIGKISTDTTHRTVPRR